MVLPPRRRHKTHGIQEPRLLVFFGWSGSRKERTRSLKEAGSLRLSCATPRADIAAELFVCSLTVHPLRVRPTDRPARMRPAWTRRCLIRHRVGFLVRAGLVPEVSTQYIE